jgi:hypothetical protein
MGTPTVDALTIPPMDPAISKRLLAIAKKLDDLDEERAQLIIEAREAGASLREIAAVAGMSHVGIKKLLGRHLHPNCPGNTPKSHHTTPTHTHPNREISHSALNHPVLN